MNKVFKTILIILIAIFGAGILFIDSVQAQPLKNLVVEYWSETENKWVPLSYWSETENKWLPSKVSIFSETNFLPGQGITRLVKVTNNSVQSQRIATEAINKNDPNRLGDVLNLEIKEGGARLYNDALSKFFTAGEVYLSDLGPNSSTTYDFIVTFYSGAGNSFQGKSLSFDLLIGFQGEEGGILPGAGGGVGGYLPPGLTIPEESVKITVTETSVVIEWTTSYPATSQVIYAKEGESRTLCLTQTEGCALGAPPKYGYERTTPEYDVSPKVTSHSVTISGLDSGTKYYYRTVSHASLAISQEHTFTTLGAKVEEKVKEEIKEEIAPPEEEVLAPTGEEIEKAPEEEIVGPEEVEKPILAKERSLGEIFATEGLLAAIGAIPFNLRIILIFATIIIVALLVSQLIKKRKKLKI
ncbi:MAG: hypothetical protein COY72_01855 [Candidatus Nealsonbacteria bacterium CG_4_10_14_0_8_um_filter_35_10]|uniref:Purple acid phosphatase N-terminal domain-containing protein n=2 Tax=Patescibacteria group TaxID=1783273 RepID=A0A2M7R7E9_9BACT|nr:MAG: hypothetical protein COT03_02205 [Candidatus Shapirobacteria bacterium CG07_land_8_20_14_0_80_39_18]PIY90740.1 MAG: hypothetical protein COY72_01855 [Candidatus Nealsonbacteria bacterium CG_4_10_14_0_8_um_filter_35_10]